jgi:hypothetical protein
MRKSVTVVLAIIILVGGNALFARDHQDNAGGAGGMSHEHMGQRGSENTNAQWTEGATKGQERSGSRHQDGEGNGGGGHANHGKDKHKGHDNGGKHKGHGNGSKHKGHQGKDHGGH